MALQYNWQPLQAPSTCACGTKFAIEHALPCPKGGLGLPSIQHYEIRDLTADLLTEVCSDVCIEPDLQPAGGEELSGSSSNTQDAARLDIAANGFWGGHFECIFDVRIFNPHAPSNRTLHCYRKHEKKCQYEQQVKDRTCFVYSSCLVSNRWYDQRSNSSFYKRLASCWFFHLVSSLMHMNVFVLLKQSKCIPTTCTCTYCMV